MTNQQTEHVPSNWEMFTDDELLYEYERLRGKVDDLQHSRNVSQYQHSRYENCMKRLDILEIRLDSRGIDT